MKRKRTRELFLWSLNFCVLIVQCCAGFAQAIPFADNGALKMFYDNRMYPQAVEYEKSVYIVWRGHKGFPYIISYDLESRRFLKPFMLLTGMEDQVDAKKYKKDHHYAPVTWVDSKGYVHVLFGCHVSAGVHLISKRPGDITQWQEGSAVSDTLSYPKVHQIHDNKTLIYFRQGGHLGSWKYRISSNRGRTWVGPNNSLVDLNTEPQDGLLADHAGSYHTTHVSKDGRMLHVAFIWKVEEPVLNSRYNSMLTDHTQRYNLYYLKVDLPSGKAFNYNGKELASPVNKAAADRECLIWDTQERVVAVGPSIYLDENDQPYFLLPVSDETPYKCRFYFVRRQNDQWVKTAIAPTSHPFNACHLHRSEDGLFKAYLVTGEGENISEEEMERYGWGDRVQEWVSDDNGENWKLSKDLTPVIGHKYQNIKFVSQSVRGITRDILLFYGWQDSNGDGTGFLWDNRK
ncbi:BNR repeat-containing protein [Acidobacteria bacterium AH-259-O06]|nr:BNR repeat-containing protein [Acidobacteria bacterium AH-259-O06]